MSRASVARGIATAAALAAAVSCGGAAGAGDALHLAIINDPILNAVIAPDIGSILVNKIVFPGLVRPNESLEPEPDLAERWEVSDDGTVYTFHLRPGVVWHDGAPFTARDVAFTFDRIADSTTGTLLWSDFAPIDSVRTPDSLTVEFFLEAPYAPFLTLLGHNAGIIPAHAFPPGASLRDQVAFNRSRPIGTGPYRVSESVPGSYLVLTANERYHGAQPSIPTIVVKIVPDVNAQVAQLRAGELDLITLEPALLPGVEDDPDLRIEQVGVPQHYYVGFNQDLPRFEPAAVRRALMLAVDRQAIIDGVLKGHADYPQGTIPIVLRAYYAADLPRIPHDTAAALALLAEAGWRRSADGKLRDQAGDPFRFSMMIDKGNPSREQAALAVQQDLARIGIEVTLQTLEFSALVRDYLLPRNYEAVLVWWNTPLDPDQYSYYATDQANNDYGYSNPAADSLLLAGRRAVDPEARAAAYRAFQAVEAEDPPVLVLYYPRELQVHRARLSGIPRLGIRDALRHVERFRLESR
ncbi:MAG: ABC transporter substrate-binding protein [Gemmatimonadales bacterium]